ncbi:ABC transporter ATP-binding protein [Limisalsivibrio acetivorans]|uniref:ABC transporter ATP-binding protein n=1 Tax=Limisalsivibrio acetivorans TaxID=1304888 RepID=UPI0003B3983D|nr:ABC transporter ATP-binding protein [Limisalsivibrio acetivorans]
MLRADSIEFSYSSEKKVLKGVGFEAERGEIVAVLGPNGSGKTTLLKNINRVLKPSAGIVSLGGRDVSSIPGREAAKVFGYMPQSSYENPVSVYEAVLVGRKPWMSGGSMTKHDHEVAEKVLDRLGLAPLAFRYTDELSGGELQKVALARALAQEPEVLLLDEPINHLDISNQVLVMNAVLNLTRETGIIAVTVLHDINFALRAASKLVILKDGEVAASGAPDILTKELVREVYGVEVCFAETCGHRVMVNIL